jgi:hypothetical protein
MKAKRFVEVLWLDAEGHAAWTADKDADKIASPVVTMRGYLVRRNKKVVVLAMGYHEDSWLNVFTIPAGMVRKVTTL